MARKKKKLRPVYMRNYKRNSTQKKKNTLRTAYNKN